jgi:hypothetical protein
MELFHYLASLNPFVQCALGWAAAMAVAALLGLVCRAFRRGPDPRECELERLAAELGLNFSAEEPQDLALHVFRLDQVMADLPEETPDLRVIERMPRTRNVLSGRTRGMQVIAFDSTTNLTGESGDFTGLTNESEYFAGGQIPSMSVLLVVREAKTSHLAIRPKRLADAVVGELDSRCVHFASNAEFEKRFRVSGSDEEFARATVNPPMMDYLLGHRGWFIELHDRDAIIYDCQEWPPERFKEALEVLSGFLAHIPEDVPLPG